MPKLTKGFVLSAKQYFDLSCGAITQAEPEYFRRHAKEHAQITKIRIFCDNREAICTSKFPYLYIESLVQLLRCDMGGGRVEVS